MKFNRSQSVSFKSVEDGRYIGVLVGFSYIGIQDGGKFGSRPKCMLRWELHAYDEPHPILVDDEGLIHVVTQSFSATIQGDQSYLYRCLVAHGIAVPGAGVVDSKEWYGKAAALTIEGTPGSRGDRTFMNVTEINPVDHAVNIQPALQYEHWEPEDEAPPPIWAKAMIERSRDIHQRASQTGGTTRQAPAPVQGRLPAGRPDNPSSDYRPPAGYQSPDIDEEDIPF